MTDHDAIEPRVRLNRACKEPGPCPDLEAAYLDLYDEVQRLRAALEIITMMHDGNPPLPLADMPSVEYARRTIRNIHQEARAALTCSAAPMPDADECARA